jgi:hypothetical protein
MEQRSAIDIPALNRFLMQVQSYDDDLRFHPGPVPYICHYTNLEGLLGIVAHHDLWLTHSRYSNDDEELTHGYRVVGEVIDGQLTAPADRTRKRFLKEVKDILTSPSPEGVYICCFCQDDDLLSQWRSYAANGTGVCISFNHRDFSYITGPDSPPRGLVRLWKVFYAAATQQEIVRAALDFAFRDGDSRSLADRARQAADAILFFIPTFKHEKFMEENEVRLIFTPAPDFSSQPQFRVSRGMLVPYYSLRELSGNPPTPRLLPVTAVRVGPSVNKRENVESTRMLLAKSGYVGVNVDSSATPYRG